LRQAVHSPVLVAGTLLLILLASGCSFDRAWKAAATPSFPTDNFEGRWTGTWVSEVNGHTDKLRCLITRQPDGKYSARYHAKYRKVLSFGYTATLEAKQTGDIYHFSGEADLGWYAGGVYRYKGHANRTNFFSTYSNKYDHGTFQMGRPK